MLEVQVKLKEHDQRFSSIDNNLAVLKSDVSVIKADIKSFRTEVDERFIYLGSLMEDQSRKLQLIYEVVQTNKESTYAREFQDERYQRHDNRIAAVEAAYRDLRK